MQFYANLFIYYFFYYYYYHFFFCQGFFFSFKLKFSSSMFLLILKHFIVLPVRAI